MGLILLPPLGLNFRYNVRALHLHAGAKLGPYEVLAPLGAGGMGEVFKARDTRLDRIVAIKSSKTGFGERFEREARAIAALNHPHICQLFDVGPDYLVMEYVEGAPLKGPLPLDQALEYAMQIASALDAAHSHKITHRDLKPANVLVSKAGVKLLDFGLAKIEKPVEAGEETVTIGLTMKGQIVGTLSYMSPEQVNGQEASPLSDIFSFGLVLYEMLTGKRAFEGATPASVLAAILERPAPSVGELAPEALNRVLKRCLEKDPEKRWQSARDLRAALELISPEAARAEEKLVPARGRRAFPWPVVAALATTSAAAMALVHFREQPAMPEVKRFKIAAPQGQEFAGGFSLSPDGRYLAFAASEKGSLKLWLRPMNSVEATPLGELGRINPQTGWAWSPDSRSIVWESNEGKLRRHDIGAGTYEVGSGPAQELTWGRDTVLLRIQDRMLRIPAAGGVSTELTTLRGSSHPTFLPDGQHFLYHRDEAIWAGSLDGREEHKKLIGDIQQTNLRYGPEPDGETGHLFYAVSGTLMAQPFDPEAMEVRGEAFTVVNGVARGGGGYAAFSVAADGTLVYRPGTSDRLSTLFNRDGSVIRSLPGQAGLALSPDGSKAALIQGADMMIADLKRNTLERFLIDCCRNPVWSPDGSQIVFTMGRKDLYVKPSNGARAEELLFESAQPKYPMDWTRDGRYIVFGTQDQKSGWDIWLLDMKDKKATPFLTTEGDQVRAQVSPDGRWIAYTSNESGPATVFVRSFPDGNARWLIAPGDQPRWRRDGRELFFRTGALNAVDVPPGPEFHPGAPKPVLNSLGPGPGPGSTSYWDVTPDSQQFLVTTFAPEVVSAPITVVLNWQSAVRK